MDFTPGSSVAIILLNWNAFAYTKACIDSLLEVKYSDFKIILVDNGSEDGSLQKLTDLFPMVTILPAKENLGFAGGNNLGINFALENNFRYVLLLNNDTLVKPDFLAPMVHVLEHGHDCAAVQPLIYFLHDQGKLWNAGGKYFKWLARSKTLYAIPDSNHPYSTDWITGCAFLVKTEVIKEIGPLNEAYFAYFEDVDWSLRMRMAGFSLKVVPSSIIYHEAGASSKSIKEGKEGFLNPKVHYLNVRNQILQLRKYASFPYGIIAWPYNFFKIFLIGVYFLGRGRWGKLRAVCSGVKDGLNQK